MRLRSDLHVNALQRQAEAAGLMFSVLRRGHDEGGLIFIKWVEGREACLLTEQTVAEVRRWVRRGEAGPEAEINVRLSKEEGFDPDLWIVEVLGRFSLIETVLDPADAP